MPNFKEFDFISKIPRLQAPHLSLGIGDDAAVFQGQGPWSISTDALAEGQHFLSDDDPFLIGQKTASVNLSDMAAMGCQPKFFLLNLHIDDNWANPEKLSQFMQGLQSQLQKFETVLIGGDTVRNKGGGLQVSGTILGQPFCSAPILRSEAQAGDLICVTGQLGGSFPHRHLRFEPRVHLSKIICEQLQPTAMMDLSDGLAQDLMHICKASQVGARIRAQNIPVHPDLDTQDKTQKQRLNAALSDGEDFELLFCISPNTNLKDLSDLQISVIGKITNHPDEYLIQWDQKQDHVPLEPKGFSHDA
jgi:thiamine-monophosphate kinase